MRKIFTLLILLLLLPVTALAVEGAPNTLYVGDKGLSVANDSYWTTDANGKLTQSAADQSWNVKYDPSTATLTLRGATIQGADNTGSPPYGAGIYALCSQDQPVALTIELIGTNTITGYYGIFLNAEIDASSYGTNATLTITGENNGSLGVSGSDHGIYVKSGTGNASLNIENVAVTSSTNGNSAAGVYVMSSSNATGSPNLSLAVNGGSLTASGGTSGDGIQFYVGSSEANGATTNLTVSENAIVDARTGGISASGVSVNPNVTIGSTDSTSGIVFDGTKGTVYGDVTLQEDLKIGEGESLTIGKDASLTVPSGTTLTNNGTVTTTDGGSLTNQGTINNSGTLPDSIEGSQPPKINTQPQSVVVTIGQTAEFTVVASASEGDALSYQWQQKTTDSGSDWTNVGSATSSNTYTIDNTTTSMSSYQYRCVVSNSAGSVTSSAATLTVKHNLVKVEAETPTCTEPGNIEYWYCEGCNKYFSDEAGTQVITEEATKLPALGHDWDKPIYKWSNDNTACTAARTCKRDKNHRETAQATVTSEQTQAPTCTESGKTTYTAKFAVDWAKKRTKTVADIPATGHHYVNGYCTECGHRDPDYRPDPISYYNIYVEDVCDGVEVSASKQVVREGGSISLYVEKDTANYTFDNFKVYYKRSYYGTWDELKEGTQPGEYPINNIWTHIYIKAQGAEEKEDPTGIESIEGVKVYTKDGSLYVQTPQREQVLVISMSGAVVKNEEQIGLKQYHGLQPGIYIVRVGDKAYKVRLN